MAPPEEDPSRGAEKPELRPRDARGGFVSRLTIEVIEDIDQALAAGGSMETAAAFSGVHVSTFRQWLAEARRAERGPRPMREGDSMKVDLLHVVEKGIADFKLALTGGIYQHGRDSWQAWAWLAERRFPDEFGRRQRIEHGNADGEPFRVAPSPVFDPSKLSDEELETAIRLLEKARPDGVRQPRQLEPGELRIIEG